MTPEQHRFIETLYQDHHKAMRYVADRIVRDREQAADLVSQAFLIAILKIDVIMFCDDPTKWLFHVLKNLARDEYRRVKLHDLVPLDNLGDVPVGADPLSFQNYLPAGLSQEERDILTLRIDKEMDYGEIARLMNLSGDACRMRYSRAKKHCAELMRG